jgi:hypothetical protein
MTHDGYGRSQPHPIGQLTHKRNSDPAANKEETEETVPSLNWKC